MTKLKDRYRLKQLAGFSLIELLVVLVIVGLVTSLLVEGLGTTWRSFDKLSAKGLNMTQAQLPLSWFEESVSGAVLYHPDKPVVSGDSQQFEFITMNVPNDERHVPQQVLWSIQQKNTTSGLAYWQLAFKAELAENELVIMQFDQQPRFEYWNGQQWLNDFQPDNSLLPTAIRLVSDEIILIIAKPVRPVLADVPPEMALFGEYEF
jgi:general secretion pathway protein J